MMGFMFRLLFCWGDRIKPGRTVTDFITFPDLAPTLLEVTGVPLDDQMTGSSFLPQLVATDSGRIDCKARSHPFGEGATRYWTD